MAQNSPFINPVNTFTDYGAESRDIERQRKMAELLQQQSATPIEERPGVPISWTQGLAKMLQAYYGKQGMDESMQKEKDLAARAREAGASDVTGMMGALQGTPAKPAGAYGEEGLPLENPAQPAQAPDRSRALAIALQSQSPMVQSVGSQLLAQMLKGPESLFGKVDPKDYTPESVRRYATTQDPSVLIPVRKMEFVNTGGASQAVNPYNATPGQVIPHTISPDASANLGQRQYEWQNISPVERARLGLEGQKVGIERAGLGLRQGEFQWNTGQQPPAPIGYGGGGVSLPPAAPMPNIQPNAMPQGGVPAPSRPQQPMPQAPAQPAAPLVAGGQLQPAGVTPRALAELAGEREKQRQGAQQILNYIQYDPKTDSDKISKLIDQSTSGVVQNYMAHAKGALTGTATSGREAIGALASEASKMTMDLMGGKLGTGISNADRDFVMQQLGDVANANLPANERHAAWAQARARLQNAVRQQPQSTGATGSFAPPMDAIDAEIARRRGGKR